MNAVVFLLVRQYVNRIRRLFSKPLKAILTILAVLTIAIGPVIMLINPKFYDGLVGARGREVAIAGIQLFIGITLILSALSQQGGLFVFRSEHTVQRADDKEDDPAVFHSPVASWIGTDIGVPVLLFPMAHRERDDPAEAAGDTLVMSLLCQYFYTLLLYLYPGHCHEGLKKRLKNRAWIFFGVVLLIYAVIWLANGRDFGEAAIKFSLTHITTPSRCSAGQSGPLRRCWMANTLQASYRRHCCWPYRDPCLPGYIIHRMSISTKRRSWTPSGCSRWRMPSGAADMM